MPRSKYYVNDVGTKIIVDVGEDISDAITMQLNIKKPDSSTVTWNATLEGLTFLVYTVQSGDWNIVGRYLLQAYVVTPDWTGRGDTTSFEISDSFK
jgi:hypothetical protein